MTLKEKFKEQNIYINPYSFKLTIESAETFEKIAEDFAIEFAKWCDENLSEGESYRKALEIYKKHHEDN